jgi:hypothetical protein
VWLVAVQVVGLLGLHAASAAALRDELVRPDSVQLVVHGSMYRTSMTQHARAAGLAVQAWAHHSL